MDWSILIGHVDHEAVINMRERAEAERRALGGK